MDRSRIKLMRSRLRQSRGLEREKKNEEKLKVRKKIVKRHGGNSLPRQMKLLATSDGFWSPPQEFKPSRLSGNVRAGECSESTKAKKSHPLSSKDSQKSTSSSTDKKTPKCVKEIGKATNSSQKSSKCTSELKRLKTTVGFWSPGISETSVMSVKDPGKVVSKEKETSVSRSQTSNTISELKRLQTTDGFWSPSFKNSSPRQSSRDTSPSSTNSSMDRMTRRLSLKQGEKKKDGHLKTSEKEKPDKNSISMKRTRSSSLITEKVKSTPVLLSSDKETAPCKSEPLSKHAKRDVIKVKEEPVVLRKAKASLVNPNSADTPNVKKVPKLKDVSPTSSARTNPNCQKTSTSNVSDFLQNSELRRLNTSDGFWSPLPKISYVLGACEKRSFRKTSVQSQSQLLEHRKKKLKSLKLKARNRRHPTPNVNRRQSCPEQKPTNFKQDVVMAGQGGTHPPAPDKQKRPKKFIFGARRKKFRRKKRALKKEQSECAEANTSSVADAVCKTDKDGRETSKGDHISVEVTKETKALRKRRQTLLPKRNITHVKKSIDRHANKDGHINQSVEVSMESEENVDSCQPEAHKSTSSISSLRSEHSDEKKSKRGNGNSKVKRVRRREAQLLGNKELPELGRRRSTHPSGRRPTVPARRGVARGQGRMRLVRRGTRRLENTQRSGIGKKDTRAHRKRGSKSVGLEIARKAKHKMSPETDDKGSARLGNTINTKLVSWGLRDQKGQSLKKSPVHSTSGENHSNIFDIMQEVTEQIGDIHNEKAFSDTSEISLPFISNIDKVSSDIKPDQKDEVKIKCYQIEKELNLDKKGNVMLPKPFTSINGVDTNTDIKEKSVSEVDGKDEKVPHAVLEVSDQGFECETKMELDSQGGHDVNSDKDVKQTDDGQIEKIPSFELKASETQVETVHCADDAKDEVENNLKEGDSSREPEKTLSEENTDNNKTLIGEKEHIGDVECDCGKEDTNALFKLKSIDDKAHQTELSHDETTVEKEGSESNSHCVSSLQTEETSLDADDASCAGHEKSTVDNGVVKDTETDHQVCDKDSADDATAITKDSAIKYALSEKSCHEHPDSQLQQKNDSQSSEAETALPENQLLESKAARDLLEVSSDQVVEYTIEPIRQTETEEVKEVELAAQDGFTPVLPSTINHCNQNLCTLATNNTKVAEHLIADQSSVEKFTEDNNLEKIDELVLDGITTSLEEPSSKSQMAGQVLAAKDNCSSVKEIGKGAVHKNYVINSKQEFLCKDDVLLLNSNSDTATTEKVGKGDTSLSPHNPLRRVKKRRYNSWRRGIVKKAKRISTQSKRQQSHNSLCPDSIVQMKSLTGSKKEEISSHSSHSNRVGKLTPMSQSDNVAELAEQASKILDVSSDREKPKKLLKALKRLKTDANLANASIDTKTLQTRARKGLLPVTHCGVAKRQKLVASERKVLHPESTKELKIVSAFPLSDGLAELQSFGDELPKLEKTCLPKLSPLSLVTIRPEDQSPVAAGPPVLTPQQPIDFFIPTNVDTKSAASGEDEIVNESVDDTDFHLYLSGASDDEGMNDQQNQTATDIFSGTSMTNQGRSLQVCALAEETKASSVFSVSAFFPKCNPPTSMTPASCKSKMRGKKGRPPGIRVSQRDVLVQRPKSVHKSIPPIHIPPRPMRTFEFRKKTTRSPLQMLEMKRKQEEAIYDLEMERIQARKIIRREKRIARTPVVDPAEQEIASYFNLRPCSVVLTNFVKKLNFNETISDLYHENISSSAYSPEYEDDIEDEDWCADLEDVEDEFEDDCVEQAKSTKRPYIPRLKLKRVSKKGKPTLITSKARNLVSKLKSPEQEPLKLVIKTEPLSDAEDPPRNLPSEPQGSTMFENNYVEFLKQRSADSKAPVSKSSSLQKASHLSSARSVMKNRTNVHMSNQGQAKKNDIVRNSVLMPTKSSSSQSLSDTLVSQDQVAVSISKHACPILASQNMSNTDAPKSINVAVPEGLELGIEEEEDMLIVDLTSPDSKQEDTRLMDETATCSPKDQIRPLALCPDEKREVKASNATLSMPISPFSALSSEKCMNKSDSATEERGICNSSANDREGASGNKTKQVNSVEPESDLDAAGTAKIDLNKAKGEGASLAIDSASTFSTFLSKMTDGKRDNVVTGSQTPKAAVPSEVKGTVHRDLSLEVSESSNTESLNKDGVTQGKVHDLQETHEELIDKQLGSVEKPVVEPGNNTDTEVTSFEMRRDIPSNYENMDILAPSNNNDNTNNNNNVVKPCKTLKSVDSSSPVHSTSEEPKAENRKLKSIPSSFKQMSGSYKCNRCSFTAVSKLSIESHIYSHIPGIHFQCIKCQSEFSSMNAINTHFRNSHPNTETEFYISRNVEESNFYTISKEEEETVTSQITTGTGGQSPPLIISLVVSGGPRSVRSSSASRRFVCTHCGFSTNVKEDIQQHVSDLHATQSLYTCTLCKDSVGLSESEIKEHSASVHPSRQRPYVKLPDFYDADQLAMVETNGNSEERGANVLRVSTVFPGDDTSLEQTSVGHQMKAKDYLYLQEGWKGKTSAEADSTTATDYSDENLVEATAENEEAKDLSKEESCSSEAKSSTTDEKEPSEEDLPWVPPAKECDASVLKIAEVVSLSGISCSLEDNLTTDVNVRSPQMTSREETSGNSHVKLSESSSPEVFLSSHTVISSSSLAHLKSSISDSFVSHPVDNISVTATSHSQSPLPSLLERDTTSSQPLTEFLVLDHCNPPATSKISSPVTLENESNTQVKMAGCAAPPLVSTITASSSALSSSTTSTSSSKAVTQAVSSEKAVVSPPCADMDTHSSLPGIVSNASSQAKILSVDTPLSEDDQGPGSCMKDSSNTSTDVSEKNFSGTTSESSSSSTSSVAGGLPLSYQCKSCKVHTPYLLMMVRHLKSRHPKILCFSCPYCKSGQSFNTQKQLRHHVRSMHPDKVDKNEMSLSDEAKKFVEAMVLPKSPQCIQVGNRLILEEDIHTCTICSLRMTSLSSVYDHLNEKHSDLFEFVCPSCQSFKNKSLQVVSDHCMAVHQSELDKDKVHVSVPKYLFTILSCISKQAKYIEKNLSSSSSSVSSKDSSENSNTSEEAGSTGRDESEGSDPQLLKPQATPSKGLHPNQAGHIGPLMKAPIPPPAHSVPPTMSMQTGVALDMLTKQVPVMAIPIMAPTTMTPTTRSVVAISSSLFDTSTLSHPKSSSSTLSPAPILPLGASPGMVPQQRAAKSPYSLPVLNVPTIRPKPAPIMQQPRQPVRPGVERSNLNANSTPQNGNNAHASVDQLPEDEPNPDAFKIFNLRPTGLTPPVMAAPVSVAQATPSVFPPCSSSASLPSGFIPGPVAGFPAAMVIPPALLHSPFPFAAASINNPLQIVADGGKGQGKFPVQPVQNIRPMPPVMTGQLPQPHMQNVAQAKQLLHQQQQKQRQQIASQNTPTNATVQSHGVGHSPRYSQNPLHPQLANAMIMEQQRAIRPVLPSIALSSSSQFMSPHPSPSSISTLSASSNPSKKGRKSSALYRCPYCASGPPLKALDVASHIRHAHPGRQVIFQKTT